MENLERIYQNNYDLYELLNSFAINGNKFYEKSFYINIIKQLRSCSDDQAALIFKESDGFFEKKIHYICEIQDEPEIFYASVMQESCRECEEKVEDHESSIVYKFNKKTELSDYNSSLLHKNFSPESIPVVEDLKSNFYKIIPFIGAGISKELDLPLWLEILQTAKDKLVDDHHSTFDFYCKLGDIDKLINFIQDVIPLYDTDKKLKKDLILPQVRRKFQKEHLENSTAHYILKLDSPYIITTNYDRILEQINTTFYLNYDESKNLNNFSGFDDLDKTKYIFHIHGDVNDIDSMIVTKNDYKLMYENDSSQRTLTALISRKSLLFMGFSLNDKYFSKEFSNICAANKDYAKNYMICLEGQSSADLIKENINYITIQTQSIGKNAYDAKEQYKFLLNYINGQIFI